MDLRVKLQHAKPSTQHPCYMGLNCTWLEGGFLLCEALPWLPASDPERDFPEYGETRNPRMIVLAIVVSFELH